MLKVVVSIGALVVIGLFVYIVAIFDPWGWGLVQSEKFSWEEFNKVKEGDRIDLVIERLGEPVRSGDYEVTTDDPRDCCVAGGCKEYIFAGALWGTSFKEAIVITDPKGHVTLALARQEV